MSSTLISESREIRPKADYYLRSVAHEILHMPFPEICVQEVLLYLLGDIHSECQTYQML